MRRLSLIPTALFLAAALLFSFASPALAQDTYTGGAITVTHDAAGVTTITGLETGDFVGDVTISAASGKVLYEGPVPAGGVVTVQGAVGNIATGEVVTVQGVAADGSTILASSMKKSIRVVTDPAPQPAPAPAHRPSSCSRRPSSWFSLPQPLRSPPLLRPRRPPRPLPSPVPTLASLSSLAPH